MKHSKKYYIVVFLLLSIMLGTSVSQVSSSKNLSLMNERGGRTISGQILFPPLYGTSTYLIDNTGNVNHTWTSSYTPGAAVYWLGNGTILRTIRVGFSSEGGAGGGVQKVTWDGTITWDYRYNTNGHLSHHDIKVLPNGNVIMIAWETKTRNEAIAAGRDPNHINGNTFLVDHIIEVKPTGPTSGDIVWEWHVWDHLIQDYDSSKANYGVVGDHPELVDINYGTFFMSTDDWLHVNSIDYNPQFDQIVLSAHNFNEIWVIDHSTTTEEAASHSGGNSGKGGDLLYRWGNPQAYRAGTSTDDKLFGQHDTTWIKPGLPGAGHILIFNNGVGRPGGQYSSVDEIAPPVDDQGNYYLEPGSAYGPENLTWRYTANPPSNFYAYYISGAERLKDGDTLICDGASGKFFEVTPDGTTVWQWTNPYPYPYMNDVFKIVYIPPPEPPQPPQNTTPDLNCQGNMSWANIKPGETVHGTFEVENIGDPNSTLNWTIDSYPKWGTWSFTPMSGTNLTPEQGMLTVQVYVTAPDQTNTQFQGYIRVVNTENSSDFNLIPIYLTTSLPVPQPQTHQMSTQCRIFIYERQADFLKE
jgi:hypothetical protein